MHTGSVPGELFLNGCRCTRLSTAHRRGGRHRAPNYGLYEIAVNTTENRFNNFVLREAGAAAFTGVSQPQKSRRKSEYTWVKQGF